LKESKGLSNQIILLKGISTSVLYYPKPYMRIMGDIDLLVSKDDQVILENICVKLGYEQTSEQPASFYETIHHSMPFYHQDKKVWIEIHTSLFPKSSQLSLEDAFDYEYIIQNTQSSEIENTPSTHISTPISLIYTCSHFVHEHNWGKGIIRIIDIIYILNKIEENNSWNALLLEVNGSITNSAYLYIILTFLHETEIFIVRKQVLQSLKIKQKSQNVFSLFILHKIMYKYILEGHDFGKITSINNINIIWNTLINSQCNPLTNLSMIIWNLLFPPGKTNRYSLSKMSSRVRNIF